MKLKENFGCEKSKMRFSKPISRYLKKMGLDYLIEVPRRKRGLTSSGSPQQCHQNVRKLVETFGGNQLKGYMVEYIPVGMMPGSEELAFLPPSKFSKSKFQTLELTFHSVWITPEGKAVDVTEFPNSPPVKTIPFIPIQLEPEITTEWLSGNSLLIGPNFRKKGFHLKNFYEDPYLIKNWKRLTKKHLYKCPENLKIEKTREWVKKGNGFSKPSLGTGIYIN